MSASTNTEFRTRVAAALADGTITDDGHSLFSPEHYSPHFTAEELGKAGIIRKHKSDGSIKGTIFGADGSVIESVEAISNLSFLYWVCLSLGDHRVPKASGRGSQAWELVSFIRETLAK